MAIAGNFDRTLRRGPYLVGWGDVLRESGAGFFRSHLSSQKWLPIFRLHTRISLKKYPFDTVPPDPRLESGAGVCQTGPNFLVKSFEYVNKIDFYSIAYINHRVLFTIPIMVTSTEMSFSMLK
jgi:hypothetical protein